MDGASRHFRGETAGISFKCRGSRGLIWANRGKKTIANWFGNSNDRFGERLGDHHHLHTTQERIDLPRAIRREAREDCETEFQVATCAAVGYRVETSLWITEVERVVRLLRCRLVEVIIPLGLIHRPSTFSPGILWPGRHRFKGHRVITTRRTSTLPL